MNSFRVMTVLSARCGVILMCLAGGCQSVKGKLENQRYHSPDGRMSVALPDIPEHMMKLEDGQYGEGRLLLRVTSDFGGLHRIEAAPLAPEEAERLASVDQHARADVCAAFLEQGLIPRAQADADEVTFRPVTKMPDVRGGAAYTESLYPGRGFSVTYADRDGDGKREKYFSDELRGYLCFILDGYVLVAQVAQSADPHRDTNRLDNRLRDRVIAWAEGVTIHPVEP